MTHAEYMREYRKTHGRPSRAGVRYRVPTGPVYPALARKPWVETWCFICRGTGWVCKRHDGTPYGECCGAPRQACPCNPNQEER